MELKESKEKFIENWGVLGSNWGINKTMAQIHALLLISPEALTTEEVMEELAISRGNANMNLRGLIEWGIITKQHKKRERKEYFYADKDIWQVAKKITKERSKREIEPVINILTDLKEIKGNTEEINQFRETMNELENFTTKLNSIVDKFVKSDENWFYKNLLKLVK